MKEMENIEQVLRKEKKNAHFAQSYNFCRKFDGKGFCDWITDFSVNAGQFARGEKYQNAKNTRNSQNLLINDADHIKMYFTAIEDKRPNVIIHKGR